MLDAVSYIVLATIRLGTPIAITAVGATISERTGVVNIGLEGIMGMGAFLAVLGSYWTCLLYTSNDVRTFANIFLYKP